MSSRLRRNKAGLLNQPTCVDRLRRRSIRARRSLVGILHAILLGEELSSCREYQRLTLSFFCLLRSVPLCPPCPTTPKERTRQHLRNFVEHIKVALAALAELGSLS
jgi:hypothetical protein